MSRPLNTTKKFILVTVAMLVLVNLSTLFVDKPAALYVYHSHLVRNVIPIFLHMFTGSANPNNEIPDFLIPMTVVITIATWAGYWHRVRQGHFDRRADFFKIVGTAMPLALFVKAITKFVFGRINTRTWVNHPSISTDFHWFDGAGSYHGFPSGHMVVLTPLFIALWCFYPKLKPLWAAGWISLGAALMLTGYHFVSDVIAGAYLGLLIYWFTPLLFKFKQTSSQFTFKQ